MCPHRSDLNDERAALAHGALEAYARLTGDPNAVETDAGTLMHDLLVNLRHQADRLLLDFGSINEEAAIFYTKSLLAPGGAVSELRM